MNLANPVRHHYKVVSVLKSYTVFELINSSNGRNLLANKIRIEKFNGFSAATGIQFYLRLRDSSNWVNCTKVTGLRSTHREGVFEGNQLKQGRKSLLLFEFGGQPEELIIDVYEQFYPYNKTLLDKMVNQHPSAF